jgi:hypothetical protein
MRTLMFTHPYALNKLHDELLAALPALRPIAGPDGQPAAILLVEGLPDGVLRLTVPDDADAAAITAVVAAHDPTPLPVPASPDFGSDLPANFAFQLADGVSQLRTYLALSAPTAAQSAAALKLVIRALFFLLRRAAL